MTTPGDFFPRIPQPRPPRRPGTVALICILAAGLLLILWSLPRRSWTEVRPMSTPRVDEQGREIRSVCSWCDDAAERTEALTRMGFAVSHDICPVCLVRVRAAQVPLEAKA
jgi:hypothetical protein